MDDTLFVKPLSVRDPLVRHCHNSSTRSTTVNTCPPGCGLRKIGKLDQCIGARSADRLALPSPQGKLISALAHRVMHMLAQRR